MTQYLIENFGSMIALAIQSNSPREIEQAFESFWLHKATDSHKGLQEIRPDLFFFWTNKKKLLNCLAEIEEAKILNKYSIDFDGPKFHDYCRKKADAILTDLLENHTEHFVENRQKNCNNNPYLSHQPRKTRTFEFCTH